MSLRPTALMAIGMLGSWAFSIALGGKEIETLHVGELAVRPTGPAVEILGINEGLSYPGKVEPRNPVGSPVLEAHLEEAKGALAKIGARWTRGHTLAWPRLNYMRWRQEGESWERMDAWVRHAQDQKLKLVAMIGPWRGNRTHEDTEVFELGDLETGYIAFVRAAVERYDGDGVDDMPGLRASIDHWEIDNEPDFKNAPFRPNGRVRTDFAVESQFAKLTVLTAKAIREAHSGKVQILNGGIGAPQSKHGWKYFQGLMKEDGFLDSIDVLSFHVYMHEQKVSKLKQAIGRFRTGPNTNTPLWLTETSVPSLTEKPARWWIDEKWQAEMLCRVFITALEYGVERVFWHTLIDPPPRIQNRPQRRGKGTNSNSLYARGEDGSIRLKAAGEAYARLATILEGVDWSEVKPFRTGNRREMGGGVTLGEKGWLLFSHTDSIDVVNVDFRSAEYLVGGETVGMTPLPAGGFALESKGKAIWLRP